MKSSIKTPLISVAFATMSLNSNAGFCGFKNECVNNINTSLFENLNIDSIVSNDGKERTDFVKINSKIIIDAVLNYFDDEVKMYKLSLNARQKLISLLNFYLKSHPILVVSGNGNIEFVIDDKKEFALMVKQFINTVLDDMPFLVKKVAIPLFFGGNDTIQQKLNNLDETVMNLKEKQYKDVVFDYIAGFVKRVAKTVDGKITVKKYYNDISGYYPNKNGMRITQELDESGQADNDMKILKYPFKK